MAWGKSTKQRRAARVRSWIRKHLFVLPDGRLFLSSLVFFASRTHVPNMPARMLGMGWRYSINHDGMVL